MKVLMVATAYPRYHGDVITPWLVELIQRLQGSAAPSAAGYSPPVFSWSTTSCVRSIPGAAYTMPVVAASKIIPYSPSEPICRRRPHLSP